MRLQRLRELNLAYRAQFPSLLVPISYKNVIKVPVAVPTPLNEFIRLVDLQVNLFTIVQVQILQQVCILDHSTNIIHWVSESKPLKTQSMLWKFLLVSFKSYLPQFRTSIFYLDKRLSNFRLCEKLRVRSTVCQSYSHKNYLVFTFMSRLTLHNHDLITRHQTHALDSLIHFFEFLLGQFLHQIKGIRW
jgi:hypothetical protein